MQFSFRKPHFWHPPNFAKTLFWTHCCTICVSKNAPKHYKNGEKQWKKNLDHFLTLNLDHFLTLKPPNLGPLFNFTACIYMLWCYYLGQVWPFEVLLSGPSLFFTKHCLSKNTIKIGVSALFFWKKNCARKFEVLLSGPSWSFLRCSQLGPNNNTYLAQIITPQNAFFFVFLLLKICWNTYFYSVFWTSTKIWQKRGQKKTITFDILQNTGS